MKNFFSAAMLCCILTALFCPLLSLSTFAEESVFPLDEVCFFGDSTTHGMIRYIVENDGHLGRPLCTLQREQILTPPDGTFYLRNLPQTRIRYQGQDWPLAEAMAKAAPRYLMVTVGINGLRSWSEQDFLHCYCRLLDVIAAATPHTQVILQSVYPTAKVRSEKLADFTVEKIDRLNGWIESLAKERGLPYLDSAAALKGADGWLNPAYHNGDGLHLNTAGFNCLLGYISHHPIWKGIAS